ncbi:hypothetical protein BU17DRAFT_98560 [Hysterangium stoloniferum]|nr:hypothetical protein BU17DRAFT_98560 [Hysterangium stoloniferum]
MPLLAFRLSLQTKATTPISQSTWNMISHPPMLKTSLQTLASYTKAHLASLPPALNTLFFPPAKRPEQFVLGQAVKGRNEPCAIGGVAWVVHELHSVPFEKVAEKTWKPTVALFILEELNEDTKVES